MCPRRMELYISHYFKRHFCWYESVLFPSDIPESVPAVVFVSTADSIVNAGRLTVYLRSHSVTTHEFKNGIHGGWLLAPSEQARIVDLLKTGLDLVS